MKRTVSTLLLLGCAVGASVGSAGPRAGVQGFAPAAAEERFATVDRADLVAPSGDFDRLLTVVRAKGTVRVIVGLRVAFTPEGALSAAGRGEQRRAIGAATAAVQRALVGTEYRVVHTYEFVPYVALELSEAALTRLQASGRAAALQEDLLSEPLLADSAPLVEAKESWEVGRNGKGRVIAILDTGVAKGHPFLQKSSGGSKIVSEACYSANGSCPGGVTATTASKSGVPCTYALSGCRHGTHVAGIAAGKGTSFSGVARGARLISVQVFSRFTGGDCTGQSEDPCALSFISDQIKGLERVFALRNTYAIDSVLLPVGGGRFTSNCDADSRKAAIDNLRAARIATVVASGNDGFSDAVGAPGCISTAMTVGATTKMDQVSLFSNSSVLVDFFAPGEGINSSIPGGVFTTMDGTSQAAAHVAGAFAIMGQSKPGASVAQRETALKDTGKPVTDTAATPQITRDRIRVFSAAMNFAHTGLRAGPSFALTGGNVASDGVGLARRTNANQNPSGPPPTRTFVLTGIPADARIQAVFLVWQTIGGPDKKAKFKGVSREGTLVGGSGQFTCWNTNNGGAVRTYKYNVPLAQVPGNGSYSIGGVGGVNGADGQGASLVVVYSVPGATRTGRAYLEWGAMTAKPAGAAMTHTFTGLTVPSTPVSPALHVGIGDGETFSDPAMLFNGTAVTPANFWSGSDGDYWDDDRIALSTALLPSGTTTRSNSQGATGECLTWAYAALTYKN